LKSELQWLEVCIQFLVILTAACAVNHVAGHSPAMASLSLFIVIKFWLLNQVLFYTLNVQTPAGETDFRHCVKKYLGTFKMNMDVNLTIDLDKKE